MIEHGDMTHNSPVHVHWIMKHMESKCPSLQWAKAADEATHLCLYAICFPKKRGWTAARVWCFPCFISCRRRSSSNTHTPAVCFFAPDLWHESNLGVSAWSCESYARQVVMTGRRAPACFWTASCQHGDLGAEVGAAANRRVLVFGGIRAHVSLQVPPPPLPLDLRLDLQRIRRMKIIFCWAIKTLK